MILVLACLRLLGAASEDSAVLHQARQNLTEGDTLAAIDLLQDWSSTRTPTRRIEDLLGVLQMPDEPVEADTGEQKSAQVKRDRVWRLHLEAAGLVSSKPAWEMGTTLLTRASETAIFGVPTFFDIGVASVVWSVPGEESEWGLDPLIGVMLLSKNWDARLDGWTGWLGSRWDAGLLASASRRFGDSSRFHGRFGAMAKSSRLATSFVGGFCQWYRDWRPWTLEIRTDLRLRRDPVEDSTLVTNGIPEDDSLRTMVRDARLQWIGRCQILRSIGRWSVGSAFELDARTSLSSDSWHDGQRRHHAIRQDGAGSAQGVARFAMSRTGFGEVRLGWTQALSNSDIDPDYAERNSGILVGVGTGLSF